MNLTIDVGNSKTKIAVFQQDDIIFTAGFKHLSLINIIELFNNYEITAVISAEVGKAISEEVIHYLHDKATYINFNYHCSIPIKNTYKTPETLGKDRLAGVIGASYLYPKKKYFSN